MRDVQSPPNFDELLKDKAVRTELMNYFRNPDILKLSNEINKEYLHWDELRYRPIPKDVKLEVLWAFIQFSRRTNYKRISIIKDNPKFTFKYVVGDEILQKLHDFNLNCGGKLQTDSLIPDENKKRYLIGAIMEESIASSQLEGASTTRKIAKEMLRTSRKPRNLSEQMIVNNYKTMNKVLEWKKEKLTPQLLLEMQKTVTQDTLETKDEEGRFRTTNDIVVIDNATGEVRHTPPDFNDAPSLIEQLCDFANNESETFIHPIIKACILHFLIGYIHPFTNGNGRTARAVFYWFMLKNDYWLLEYMSISRIIKKAPAQYAKAYIYSEKDENDLTYFIKFKLKAIDSALSDLRSYLQRKVKEKKQLYKFLKIIGVNERQANTLIEFDEEASKSMIIKQYQTKFGVVYQTARNDLLELTKKGFLEVRIVGKKKLMFIKSDNFDDLMERINKES